MTEDDDSSQQEMEALSRRHRHCIEDEEGDGIVRGSGTGSSGFSTTTTTPSTMMMMMKPTILCLLATETAERFAFYGFRALLVLYLVQELDYSESAAVAVYAYSNSLAYSTPILGACLADGPWGRYSVIARFGTLYLIGLIILTAAASIQTVTTTTTAEEEQHQQRSLGWKRTGSFTGLFLVCLATGGIKPVVSVRTYVDFQIVFGEINLRSSLV
jgi:dipeptide/tripeptide permease